MGVPLGVPPIGDMGRSKGEGRAGWLLHEHSTFRHSCSSFPRLRTSQQPVDLVFPLNEGPLLRFNLTFLIQPGSSGTYCTCPNELSPSVVTLGCLHDTGTRTSCDNCLSVLKLLCFTFWVYLPIRKVSWSSASKTNTPVDTGHWHRDLLTQREIRVDMKNLCTVSLLLTPSSQAA